MNIKNATVLSAVGVLVAFIGCVEYGSHEPIAADVITNSSEQQISLWRSDQNGIITPTWGLWGDRQQTRYCNDGMWAVGYQMRVESYQGGGDDTSLNSVKLSCRNPTTGASEDVSSFDGMWGSWYSIATCPGTNNYMKGARVRFEAAKGAKGDDTAANDVEFACSQGGTIHAPGGNGWGSWLDWAMCPNNTAVCGLAIRFEGSQGGGDDTAMNGLELACCNLPGGAPACNNVCGNGVCESACETPQTCLSDCGSCGDGLCSDSEDYWSCSWDCPSSCPSPPCPIP